jgi:hypothetical protein
VHRLVLLLRRLEVLEMSFVFSKRSENNLIGVHPDLVKVVRRALEISEVDFAVTEGLRTLERQKQLVKSGASQTLKSRHLTGHAVDLAPFIAGTIRWDWPPFNTIAIAMKQAALKLDVSIVWGGDWVSFKDGPHFELDRKVYP